MKIYVYLDESGSIVNTFAYMKSTNREENYFVVDFLNKVANKKCLTY